MIDGTFRLSGLVSKVIHDYIDAVGSSNEMQRFINNEIHVIYFLPNSKLFIKWTTFI